MSPRSALRQAKNRITQSATPPGRQARTAAVNCGVAGLCILHRPDEVPAIIQNYLFGSIGRRTSRATVSFCAPPWGGREGGEAAPSHHWQAAVGRAGGPRKPPDGGTRFSAQGGVVKFFSPPGPMVLLLDNRTVCRHGLHCESWLRIGLMAD